MALPIFGNAQSKKTIEEEKVQPDKKTVKDFSYKVQVGDKVIKI